MSDESNTAESYTPTVTPMRRIGGTLTEKLNKLQQVGEQGERAIESAKKSIEEFKRLLEEIRGMV